MTVSQSERESNEISGGSGNRQSRPCRVVFSELRTQPTEKKEKDNNIEGQEDGETESEYRRYRSRQIPHKLNG